MRQVLLTDIMTDPFVHTENYNYLNFCGVSPFYNPARLAAARFNEIQSLTGTLVFAEYPDVLQTLHQSAGQLLETDSVNISFMKNTAEGISLIASGYPFQQGDEIVSYVHEYPSNHYPWWLQQERGVTLKLIGDHQRHLTAESAGIKLPGPCSFSLEDIDAVVTSRTRVIALSHVQFTSGFAINLQEIGNYCKDRNIDLVIDAAQSLGSLPLLPEKYNIAAIAASGWKWLLGPVGSGLLYTRPDFRDKIKTVFAGADLMKQGQDYLNHSWNPYTDGRKFEYSTASVSLAVALNVCINELPLKHSVNHISSHIFRLHDYFVHQLNQSKLKGIVQPVRFKSEHRSGILSLVINDAEAVSRKLKDNKIICTSRGGYLRLAPHLPAQEKDIDHFVTALEAILT